MKRVDSYMKHFCHAFIAFALVSGAALLWPAPVLADEIVYYNGADSNSPLDVFAPGPNFDETTLQQESQTSVSVPNGVLMDNPVFRASSLQTTNKDAVIHNEQKIGIGRGSKNTVQWIGLELFKMEDNANWIHFRNERVIGSFDLRLNPMLMLSSSLGQTQVDLSQFFGKFYDKRRRLDQWRTKLIYTPVADTEIRVEGSNDFTFMGWLVPDDARLMTAESFFIEAESYSYSHWQLRSNVRENFFEDHNRQRAVDNLILREVLISPFNLKIGASGGYTQFEKQTGDYWSPKHFEAFGLRVIVAKEITPEWWAEARLYHGLHQEINFLQGHDSACELTLQYKTSKGLLTKLIANSYDSDGGGWWRSDLGINLEVPF